MLTSTYIQCVEKIMILRNILGYYNSFGKSKLLRISSFIFCSSIGILTLFILVQYWDIVTAPNSIYMLNTFEYIINVLTSLIFQGKFMRKTFKFLTISGNLLNTKSIKVSWVLAIFFTAMFLCRIWSFVSLTRLVPFSPPYCTNLVLLMALYLDFYTKILFFDALYQRMTLLQAKFQCDFCTVNLIGAERSNYKTNHIKKCLKVYNILLCYLEKLDYEILIWYLWTVFIYFLKSVMYFFNIIYDVVFKATITTIITASSALAFCILVISLPMILFELTKSKVDGIKKALLVHLLFDKDVNMLKESEYALEYLKLRPFSYDLCRVLPMGVRVPVTFLCLCVTYVIVLAQFRFA